MRHAVFATAALFLIGACAATSAGSDYSPRPGFAKAKADPRFEHPKGAPAVYAASDDPEADLRRLGEDGYVVMGTASFSAASNDVINERARAQARAVGASVVLVHVPPKGAALRAAPAPAANPNGPLATYGAGGRETDSLAGSGASTARRGATEHTLSDSSGGTTVTATFWIRQNIAQIHFGANSVPLPETVRAKLPGLTGVFVQSVIRGTPAADADIRAGDVIISISGLEVVDAANFKDRIDMFAGQRVSVDLVRDGKLKTVTVYLRP